MNTFHLLPSRLPLSIFLFACMLLSCSGSHDKNGSETSKENVEAKQMLQGIWVSEFDDDAVFMMRGDSVFYPGSDVMPACFKVMNDTLWLIGQHTEGYPLIRYSENRIEFVNGTGETICLDKSTEKRHRMAFETETERVESVNQNQLIRRDTTVVAASHRFRCYTQINPTTYKVIKTTYNDEGVRLERVFFDNIININIYQDAKKLMSHDFRRADFQAYVPANFLEQSILNDITYISGSGQGLTFHAQLAIPDSNLCYVVSIKIDQEGQMELQMVE